MNDIGDLPRYDRDEDAAAVAVRMVGLTDPAERAAGLTSMLADTQVWVEWLSRHRDDAVRDMRSRGASYSDVARALDLTKARAQQICRRLQTRDLPTD